MIELTPRRQRILRHVIEAYVATAQPVSSDRITRSYEDDISPATVRNEMAALEDLGLINQPHTSAGRVPTDRGYRVFVEQLMQEKGQVPLQEQRTIRHQFHQLAADPGEWAHLASAVLARRLRSAAVATPPGGQRGRVRRVELVPLDESTVLVTLILQSGSVRQVVQRMEILVDGERLTQLSNELSDRLGGKTATQGRAELALLEGDAREHAAVVVHLLDLVEEQTFASVYYEGITQLLDQPEFAQSEKLKPILNLLEHQPRLAHFLAESLAHPGVHVIIGNENRLEEMHEAAMVLTRYGSTDEAWGVIGVVGPTRLPYWRAVPMVQLLADVMDVLVQTGSGGSAGE